MAEPCCGNCQRDRNKLMQVINIVHLELTVSCEVAETRKLADRDVLAKLLKRALDALNRAMADDEYRQSRCGAMQLIQNVQNEAALLKTREGTNDGNA